MTKEKEYFYARVWLAGTSLARLLTRDGRVMHPVKDADAQEMIFYAYADNAADVEPTLAAMRGLAAELDTAADDLEAYVKNHYAAMSKVP
jgi:hypothetical protein